MSAAALLLELLARGIAVDAVDGKIRCRHAPGALPAELADRIRDCRDGVLALLADPDALREAAAREIFDAEPEPARCRACGTEHDPNAATCPVCHPPAWPRVGR